MTEEFCPRSVLQRLEQELYNLKLKGTDIDGYTNRFHELALLCPRIIEPEEVKVEQYNRGLSKNIHGDVTSSRPAGIDEAVPNSGADGARGSGKEKSGSLWSTNSGADGARGSGKEKSGSLWSSQNRT
uniref:Retrotransposon gag domain-containing protein n=1 Tax=Tanacetum cinerariifolium TaxID=118510 RepID=A0A699KXR1_TANCI|nr:hypothetical protein [Tanacetum cinerariifolium]